MKLIMKKKKGIQTFDTKCLKMETSPHLLPGAQDQRLGAGQDQPPCGSTGTSSGNCQETEIAWFGHVTRHNSLSKTILQGILEDE